MLTGERRATFHAGDDGLCSFTALGVRETWSSSIEAMPIAWLSCKTGRRGLQGDVKVVQRLYCEERLWLRRTERKETPRETREGSWCPIAANQRWSPDLVSDALANGRKFSTANLEDDCTRVFRRAGSWGLEGRFASDILTPSRSRAGRRLFCVCHRRSGGSL